MKMIPMDIPCNACRREVGGMNEYVGNNDDDE
jgi:hypothetical protein